MAGDPAGSLAAESAAIALDPASAPATCVRARMLVAQAVAGAGRWEECRRLYLAALVLCRRVDAGHEQVVLVAY